MKFSICVLFVIVAVCAFEAFAVDPTTTTATPTPTTSMASTTPTTKADGNDSMTSTMASNTTTPSHGTAITPLLSVFAAFVVASVLKSL